MKAIEEMTLLGILRLQRGLVKEALQHYDLDVARSDLASHATNFIYRVGARDGTRYALRLTAPFWRSEENLRAEVSWLKALERDTDLPVPRIITTRSGEDYVSLRPQGRAERRVLLTTWLPGTSLAFHLNPKHIARMGRLFANLHRHADSWERPSDFPGQTFDAFICRGEENLLFDVDTLKSLPAASTDLLLRVRDRVERAYAQIAEPARVIHCDLWHENIRVCRGELQPFDFEDTILGYRLHDIAMGLLDLAETVGEDRYHDLLGHFRQGYEEVLDFPSGDLLGLQMGRILWQLNWYVRNAPDALASRVAFKGRILDVAMKENRLTDPLG